MLVGILGSPGPSASGETPALVREATIADAAAVGAVHATAWQAAYRDLFEGDWLRILVEKRRHLWVSIMAGREFERTTLLVAEHGDRVSAFAHVGPHRDGSADGEIYALYAHPSLWGRGVAAAVLNSAWDLVGGAGYRTVRLWTLAGTNRARRFYTRFGFTETGQTKERDYGDGRPVLEVEYTRGTATARRARLR